MKWVLFTGLILGFKGVTAWGPYSGLFGFVKPLYSGAKAVGKEALKTGSNIITDMLNKEPEQPVRNIFKNRFIEAKDNLEQKIKKITVSGLGYKENARRKTLSLKVSAER